MKKFVFFYNSHYKFFLIFSGALVFGLDQLIKHKIRNSGGFYVCNENIALSLPYEPIIFWPIFILFLLSSFFYFKLTTKKGYSEPIFLGILVLILAGALSNIADRILLGCVLDYIKTPILFFPIFNVADVSIFLGVCLLLYYLFNNNTPNIA